MGRHVRTQRPLSSIERAALSDLLGSDVGGGMYFDRKGRPLNMISAAMLKTQRPGYERIGHNLSMGRLDEVEVSTVWLGMNHSWGEGKPVIFETMIFCADEDLNLSCWRYRTVKEAEIGHHATVKLVRLLQREPKGLAKPHRTRNRHWR